MADWGIKVSRAGIPVDTAADNQLLFSSAFGALMVVQTGTVAQGANVTHGLGYNPVFTYNVYGSVDTEFQNNSIQVDTSKLYNNGSSGTIRYYIFGADIRQTISGMNINTSPASTSTPNQDYGFKTSLQGYDVTTALLDQLVTFSGVTLSGQPVRQQMIHTMDHHDNLSTGSTYTVSHNLGYPPLFYVFVRKVGSGVYENIYLKYTVNGDSSVTFPMQNTIDGSNLTIRNNTGDAYDVAWVILKDPF